MNGGVNNFESGTPLCYEIHGKADSVFNLVSDKCTSVNALYLRAHNPSAGNIINSIGIVAGGANSNATTVLVRVMPNGQCAITAQGSQVLQPGTHQVGNVVVESQQNCIKISVPNCDRQELLFWVRCYVRTLTVSDESGIQSFNQEMIRFVVGRGLGLEQGAHGLIGEDNLWKLRVWVVCRV